MLCPTVSSDNWKFHCAKFGRHLTSILLLYFTAGNIDDDTLVQLADSVHDMINERGVCLCGVCV